MINETQPFCKFLGIENNLLLMGTETGRCLVTILIAPAFERCTRQCDVFAGNVSEDTTRLIKNCILRIKYFSLYVAAKKQTLQPTLFVLHGF
jgi:hypothetical protein